MVDDEDWVAFVMRRYFETRGFRLDFAEELEQARALLLANDYAAVISDLRLSGAHGAEGLDLVSFARERCPGTRTVLLTAYGSPALREEAARRGADLVLEKPLALPEIERILTAFLEESPS